MKQILFKRIFILPMLFLCLLFWSACKMEQIAPAHESTKDISGNWQVIKATRNGTDITSLVDFSQFRLNFNTGSYTLVNRLPFLVSQNGTYSLDNPQYPFQITFTPSGAKAAATTFTYPIVNGTRQLTINFSPGCASNAYVYVFQKAN